MRAFAALKPKIRFGFGWPWTRSGDLRLVLPFKRSWPAIIIMGAFCAVFCIPLFTVGGSTEFSGDGSLFDLLGNLFGASWLLGWSTGVAILGLIFLALLLGREVVIARLGTFIYRMEILAVGISAECDAAEMKNLRTGRPDEGAGTSWRGPHLVFDYKGESVEFASHIEGPAATDILTQIRAALITTVLDGPASDDAAVVAPVEASEPPHREASKPGGPPVTFTSPSTLALIFANLIPLAGAAFLGWDMGKIMILYWAESAIIGVFNLLKMAVIAKWVVVFAGPFFVGHYGGFMAIHLLFIYGFFMQNPNAGGGIPVSQVAGDFLILWPALVALFLSHALSFYLNFIGRGEYLDGTLQKQMGEPYKRIVVMHMTIIFGGFLAMALGSPLPALMLLIVLKISADARAHVRERSAKRGL